MSTRKNGKEPRRGDRRIVTGRTKVVPQCKMTWPKMIQFLLDYPDAIARNRIGTDFAGRIAWFYFTIRNGELQYAHSYEGKYPDFSDGSKMAAAHDFRSSIIFEAFEPKCACPTCLERVQVICCGCCKCKQL